MKPKESIMKFAKAEIQALETVTGDCGQIAGHHHVEPNSLIFEIQSTSPFNPFSLGSYENPSSDGSQGALERSGGGRRFLDACGPVAYSCNRERPTWRLAYRNFKDYEALVTNQSVEALPGVAGVRWYEIRWDAAGSYSSHQHGNHAFALFLLSTLSKALPPLPQFCGHGKSRDLQHGCAAKKHTN